MTNNSLLSFTHNSNIISNFSITPDRRQYTIFLSYLRAQQLVPYLWITLRFWTYWVMGKSEEQLPQKTVGQLLADSRLTVVYRLLRKYSANSRPNVGRMLAVCRPTVDSMSVICWPSVGWEPLSNTRKASARMEVHCISTWNELSHLSPPYCLGFLGTSLLAISYV